MATETVTVCETGAVETAPVVAPVEVVKLKSADAFAFVRIWNASSSRQDALARFAAEGYKMTYSSMVARYNSYTNPERKGGVINLKDMTRSRGGRQIDTAAVNAAIAEAAAANAVVAPATETPAVG